MRRKHCLAGMWWRKKKDHKASTLPAIVSCTGLTLCLAAHWVSSSTKVQVSELPLSPTGQPSSFCMHSNRHSGSAPLWEPKMPSWPPESTLDYRLKHSRILCDVLAHPIYRSRSRWILQPEDAQLRHNAGVHRLYILEGWLQTEFRNSAADTRNCS